MANNGYSGPGGAAPSSGGNGAATTATATAASPAPPHPVKARRSHRKSRNGCAECRRRHMRCDKNHPICFNCDTGERTCVYPNLALATAVPAEAAGGGQSKHQQQQQQQQQQTATTNILHHTQASTPISTPTSLRQEQQDADSQASEEGCHAFDATDLVVFYHAQTTMANVGLGRKGEFQQLVALAMRHRHRAPYLVDQVLALAAVHLSMHLPSTSTTTTSSTNTTTNMGGTPSSASSSTLSPSGLPPPFVSPSTTSVFTDMTSESLRHHATRRQIRAVASFKRLTTGGGGARAGAGGADAVDYDDDDPDSACTRLLFSGILSLQNLAETLCVLRSPRMRFCAFVDSIVHCFNLHRGVRAATGKPLHEFLRQATELGPMLEILNIDMTIDWRRSRRGSECAPLRDILGLEGPAAEGQGEGGVGGGGGSGFGGANDHMGATTRAAYRDAVESLQWSFDMCHGLSAQDSPHATVAFAVAAPADYVEALRRYCPEALIILAYYGVLLHRCRQYWVFGDAGARMIRAIADHVGNYWKEALRWPLSIIEGDGE